MPEVTGQRDALQYAGDQHDQWNIERKAGRTARLVDGVDLVGIAGDGARGDEQRGNVFDNSVKAEHDGCRVVCAPVEVRTGGR